MRLGAFLDIDLKILKANLQQLRSLVSPSDILFMVKANGYGHGMTPITRYSLEECSISTFGVATLSEGVNLRKSIPDRPFEIYVFSENHLHSPYAEYYSQFSLIPVLSSLTELEVFLNEMNFKHVPLVLKFNTGMNRLGFSTADLEIVSQKIKKSGRKEIYHLMTHLGRSFESLVSAPITNLQIVAFNELRQNLIRSGIQVLRTSIANSGAIEQNLGLDHTHVRPGLMVYGPSSLADNCRNQTKWRGQCLSSLKVKVLHRASIRKNTPVGYGGTCTPEDGTICILGIGYGDGFTTKLQNTVLNHASGRPIIFGRINMDMLQLFFSAACRSQQIPQEGETVEIWGHDPAHILDISDQSGIIPYELFCSLGERIPRKYSI